MTVPEGKQPMPRPTFAVALLAAAIGCANGNATTPPPPPAAPGVPAGLAIVAEGFGNYLVRWTPPAGPIDGYELQSRINGGPFEALSGPPIDPRATDSRVLATTPNEIHELDLIEVRLRTLTGKLASDWSNVAGLREIVLPGSINASTSIAFTDLGLIDVPPIIVSIEKRSLVATEMKLERAEAVAPNATAGWVRLPPSDPSVTTYTDADVLDGTAYRYRVSFGAQGVWSEASEIGTLMLAVSAPTGLTASIVSSSEGHPAGVHLQWTNRSATAQTVAISSMPFGLASGVTNTIATVPATLSATDDPGAWPFWPVQSYRVAAQRPGNFATPGFSTVARLPPYVLSGLLTLDVRTLSVPQANQYLFDGAGRIHASAPGAIRPGLFRPQGAGWESHDLTGSVRSILRPGLALDAADHPHVVYDVDFPGPPPHLLRHEWHDGTGWTSEDVLIPDAATPLAFAVDPAGKAHVLYTTGILGSGDVVHLSKEPAGWVHTTLPDVPAATNPTRSVHVAPDGTVYVSLIGSPGSASGLLTRAADGTWSAEQVPGVDAPDLAWFFPANRGHAAFAFEKFATNPAGGELWYVAQTATGWAAPELIARRTGSGGGAGSVDVGADGSRPLLVIAFPDASGKLVCELFVRSASGTWSSMTVGPACGANVAPKVGTDGKLRMVVGLGISDSSTGVPVLTEQ